MGENRYFDKVNSSFVIFKIVKKKIKPKIKIFKLKDNIKNIDKIFINITKNFDQFYIDQFQKNKKWLLYRQNYLNKCALIEASCKSTFNKKKITNNRSYTKLKDICQIANGLVSGLDKAFRCDEELFKKLNSLEKSSIRKVIKSHNLSAYINEGFQKYIFLNESKVKNLKKDYPNFYNHLSNFKEDLQKRYNYQKKINYWDWVFLRSFSLINSNQNKICVPCKLRVKSYEDINFSYIKNKFLLTQDVTSIYPKKNCRESIFYILGYLNSQIIKQWIYINNNNRGNVLEFSEAPLNNIPMKIINWENKKEVKMHERISDLTKKILINYDNKLAAKIDKLVNSLIYQ